MGNFGAKNRFEVLDGIRGVAAIFVMLYHYTLSPVIMFINANLAVDVFFILSGFVLFYSYADRLAKGMSIEEYLGRRFVRLYPLFFLGLMLGLIVLYFYVNTDKNCLHRDVLGSFLSNMFFVPFLDNEKTGSGNCPFSNLIFPANTALWSLFFEMAASVAFPLLAMLKLRILIRFVSVLFAVIILGGLYSYFLGYTPHVDFNAGWAESNFLRGFPRVFYGFTLGIVIAQCITVIKSHPIGRIVEKIKYKSLLVYIALVVVLALPLTVKYTYYLLAIGVAAPMLIIVGALTVCENRFLSSLSEFMGWLSYPVYCLHLPVYDGLKLLYDSYGITRIPLMLTSIIVTIILAIIMTKLYDEPVRAYMSRRLHRRFSAYKQRLGSGPIKFRGFPKGKDFDSLMAGGGHEQDIHVNARTDDAD